MSEKMEWLERVGFKNIKTAEIDAIPPTIIWAEK